MHPYNPRARAFQASSQATLIAAILEREPAAIATLAPMVPPMLERVVRKCLAKDPDKRWQTAADLKSELEWILESGSNPAIPVPVVAERRRHARLGWATAGVLAVVLAAAAGSYALYRPASAPSPIFRFQIPTPDGFYWQPIDAPVVSPQGTHVIFGGTQGGRRLWMRALDSLESRPIPGTEEATSPPAWSPDGRAIAFVAQGRLKRLDLVSGSAQVLTEMLAYGTPAWGPDGTILFSRDQPPFEIYQLPPASGEAKRVTVLTPGTPRATRTVAGPASGFGPAFDGFPSFLPDGRRFIFANLSQESGIYLGSLDGGDVRRLVEGVTNGLFVAPHWLIFVREGQLLAQKLTLPDATLSGDPIQIATEVYAGATNGAGFSLSPNGVLVYRSGTPQPAELKWIDRHGRRLGALGDPGYYTNPSLSRDGRYLAVGRSDGPTERRDIWIYDLVRGASSRLTFDASDELNPVWSPDGSRVAFTSDRKGRRDIYWKRVDGSGDAELVYDGDGEKSLEDWSTDGRTLIFNIGTRDLAAIPATTGNRSATPLLQAPFIQIQGRLSPDGRFLAYQSTENKRPDVFVQTFPPGGGKWQISLSGGSDPAWRADGRELFFMTERKMFGVDIRAAGSRFEADTPRELFEVADLHPEARRNRYIVSPDGQRFLVITSPQAQDSTSMSVVVNWQSQLPR